MSEKDQNNTPRRLPWVVSLRRVEKNKEGADTEQSSPSPPAPSSVRTLRRLVHLRNVLAWGWIGGLAFSCPVIFLSTDFAFRRYLALPAVAASLCWIGGCYGGQFVCSCLDEYIRRHFRMDHLSGLNYWSGGILPRGNSAYLRWSLQQSPGEAQKELLRQLWRLTEDTAYFLSDTERRALYKTLYGQDAELISAVLRVVPILGDACALPALQYLAEGNGLAATNGEVQAKAQSSLDRIQAILDLSNGPRGLLRASSAPQAPEEQLLHPVQGTRETEPGELLRAEVQK